MSGFYVIRYELGSPNASVARQEVGPLAACRSHGQAGMQSRDGAGLRWTAQRPCPNSCGDRPGGVSEHLAFSDAARGLVASRRNYVERLAADRFAMGLMPRRS